MESFFGRIENEQMILNDAGKMVEAEWLKIPDRFGDIELHEFVIMPNHFHAILEIKADSINKSSTDTGVEDGNIANLADEEQKNTLQTETEIPLSTNQKTLGNIVGAFKSLTTVEYIAGVNFGGWRPFKKKLWQRDFYDHIIRDEKAYIKISEYIKNNPARWDADKFKRS